MNIIIYERIYKKLGNDIGTPYLTSCMNAICKQEYTEKFNPSRVELFEKLIELWDLEENTLYDQPDEVGIEVERLLVIK